MILPEIDRDPILRSKLLNNQIHEGSNLTSQEVLIDDYKQIENKMSVKELRCKSQLCNNGKKSIDKFGTVSNNKFKKNQDYYTLKSESKELKYKQRIFDKNKTN